MRTAVRPIPEITPGVEAKLWCNIEKRPDGIWAWTGARVGAKLHSARVLIGYVPYYVNRVMFVWNQRKTNPSYQIPDGMYVCHRNDVTPELYDCNPDNLWLGTLQANALDRERKGRGNHQAKLGDLSWLRRHPEKATRGDKHHARITPECMARGERHGSAKLTWNQVREIRALHERGGFLRREIAEKFGVSSHNIKSIVLGKSWRSDIGNAYADSVKESRVPEYQAPSI